MKLSEAILLGRVTVDHPMPGCISHCALGMAANAVGIANETGYQRYRDLRDKWTFLDSIIATAPCECRWLDGESALAIIAHIFDSHVCGNREYLKPWTLEQLVDYVRSIEPAEESTLPDLPLSEQLRLEEEAAAEPEITERHRIDAAMNVYSRRSFSVSSTFDPASDPRFA